MRGGVVTERQAYSGVSPASIIIFTKSDENCVVTRYVIKGSRWSFHKNNCFVRVPCMLGM